MKAHNLNTDVIYELTPAEAVEVIALLTAQLANVPLVGRMSGACPTLNVIEHGQRVQRVSLSVRHTP